MNNAVISAIFLSIEKVTYIIDQLFLIRDTCDNYEYFSEYYCRIKS